MTSISIGALWTGTESGAIVGLLGFLAVTAVSLAALAQARTHIETKKVRYDDPADI